MLVINDAFNVSTRSRCVSIDCNYLLLVLLVLQKLLLKLLQVLLLQLLGQLMEERAVDGL